MSSMLPRAILFDYGNVLSRPQRADKIQTMATRLGVSVDVFLQAYCARRGTYDGGQSPADYWRLVVRELGKQALWSAGLLASLIDDDTESWSDYREEAWTLVERVRARGGLTAFLSNNVPPLMARLRAERRLGDVFDVVVASCEIGIAKPEAEIFVHCVRRLEVGAEEALFVDDHPANSGRFSLTVSMRRSGSASSSARSGSRDPISAQDEGRIDIRVVCPARNIQAGAA